jgi:hypothetical protein
MSFNIKLFMQQNVKFISFLFLLILTYQRYLEISEHKTELFCCCAPYSKTEETFAAAKNNYATGRKYITSGLRNLAPGESSRSHQPRLFFENSCFNMHGVCAHYHRWSFAARSRR